MARRPMKASRAFTWLERFLLVGGLALFVYLLRRIGPGTVKDNLVLVGWGILLIIAQELLAYTANTLGWWAAFPKPRNNVGFFSLLTFTALSRSPSSAALVISTRRGFSRLYAFSSAAGAMLTPSMFRADL